MSKVDGALTMLVLVPHHSFCNYPPHSPRRYGCSDMNIASTSAVSLSTAAISRDAPTALPSSPPSPIRVGATNVVFNVLPSPMKGGHGGEKTTDRYVEGG